MVHGTLGEERKVLHSVLREETGAIHNQPAEEISAANGIEGEEQHRLSYTCGRAPWGEGGNP